MRRPVVPIGPLACEIEGERGLGDERETEGGRDEGDGVDPGHRELADEVEGERGLGDQGEAEGDRDDGDGDGVDLGHLGAPSVWFVDAVFIGAPARGVHCAQL